MKSILIYVSVTGNTRLIAERIQAGIRQTAGECDLVPLKEANWHHLQRYDLIGFGCPPMQAHIETPSLQAFIKDMRFVGGKHAFVFATHGTHPEFIFPSMIPKLIDRGMIVIGSYGCYAPCYLSIFPWPYITAGHPDEIDLKAAKDFGQLMVSRSQRISAGETSLIPPVPPLPEIDPDQAKKMADIAERQRQRGEQPYHSSFQILREYHPDKCIYPECNLCIDNCPEDGIDLTVEPPVIGQPCVGCTFCAKICPTGAMDESAWVAASAPMIAGMMESFYVKGSVQLEAAGSFRRLIPLDDIGFDTPIYKVFNRHPQWVIGQGLQKHEGNSVDKSGTK
jgi:flavodoxin/ferredoxin